MEKTPEIIYQLSFSLFTGEIGKRAWKVISVSGTNYFIQVKRPDGRILRKKVIRESELYQISFDNNYAGIFYPDSVEDEELIRNTVLREINTFLEKKEAEIQRYRENYEKLKVAVYKKVR